MKHDVSWCYAKRENVRVDYALLHVNWPCAPVNKSTLGWSLIIGLWESTYRQLRSDVDEIGNLREQTFDILLLDGHAWVPCAIKALSYLKPNSVILVHEASLFSNPVNKASDYSSILSHCNTVDSFSGISRHTPLVLGRKPSLDHFWRNISKSIMRLRLNVFRDDASVIKAFMLIYNTLLHDRACINAVWTSL